MESFPVYIKDMASTPYKPIKKVLFTPTEPETKVLYTRFCKKAKECERGAECAFAHTYEMLNPVLCAHERAKGGCSRPETCLFMHSNESKYQYVKRACKEDLERLGIDLSGIDAEQSPMPVIKVGLSAKSSETNVKQFKSAYEELCEHARHFKGESWADIDEEEMKYQQTKEQLEIDPEFTTMKDYNRRTLYRLWGDGTFQVNRGDGVFEIVEKNGEVRKNIYDVLFSVAPLSDTEEDEEKKETDEEEVDNKKQKKHPRKTKPRKLKSSV